MNRIRLTPKQLDLLTRISQVKRWETQGGPDLSCARGLCHRRLPLVSIWIRDGGVDITDVDARPIYIVELTALGRGAIA